MRDLTRRSFLKTSSAAAGSALAFPYVRRLSISVDSTLPIPDVHCHILEHEDRGMMGQFVVVAR